MLIHTTEEYRMFRSTHSYRCENEWFRYKLPYRRRPSRSRDAYFITTKSMITTDRKGSILLPTHQTTRSPVNKTEEDNTFKLEDPGSTES